MSNSQFYFFYLSREFRELFLSDVKIFTISDFCFFEVSFIEFVANSFFAIQSVEHDSVNQLIQSKSEAMFKFTSQEMSSQDIISITFPVTWLAFAAWIGGFFIDFCFKTMIFYVFVFPFKGFLFQKGENSAPKFFILIISECIECSDQLKQIIGRGKVDFLSNFG